MIVFKRIFKKKQLEKQPAFCEKKYRGCLIISPQNFFISCLDENGKEQKIFLYNYEENHPWYKKGCWQSFYDNDRYIETCFVEKNLFEHRNVLGEDVSVDEIHILERNKGIHRMIILNINK